MSGEGARGADEPSSGVAFRFEGRVAPAAVEALTAGIGMLGVALLVLLGLMILVGGVVEAVRGEREGTLAMSLGALLAGAALWTARIVVPFRAPLVALEADARGLIVHGFGGMLVRIPWVQVREVEFRRLEVRFRAPATAGRARYVLRLPWGRAEDLVRLKNYFAERMAAARGGA
ncbi:MAG TPA: hypothetical protein VHF22_03235 [Planctomycetota bacterium]|nr:hypothetical protein [Planctomycetota bacterium]